MFSTNDGKVGRTTKCVTRGTFQQQFAGLSSGGGSTQEHEPLDAVLGPWRGRPGSPPARSPTPWSGSNTRRRQLCDTIDRPVGALERDSMV